MSDKDKIQSTFDNNKGLTVPQVAKMLGISRNTLYKRIRLYNVVTGRKVGKPLGSLKPLL